MSGAEEDASAKDEAQSVVIVCGPSSTFPLQTAAMPCVLCTFVVRTLVLRPHARVSGACSASGVRAGSPRLSRLLTRHLNAGPVTVKYRTHFFLYLHIGHVYPPKLAYALK